MAQRTDLGVARHRRLVYDTVIPAIQDVFAAYTRERQFANLRVTMDYPLVEIDYPCLVVEYTPQRVVNAGVGHEEWFMDDNNILRKWHHSRFEGTIEFNVFALTTKDRDLLADAMEEMIRFGRLDPQLTKFFYDIYGQPTAPVTPQYTQIMFNADEIDGGGNSVSIAPWSPEDTLVYETSLSCVVHGGLYSVLPTDTWEYVDKAVAQGYDTSEFEQNVTLPFPDPTLDWTNPFEWDDDAVVTGTAVISSTESFT